MNYLSDLKKGTRFIPDALIFLLFLLFNIFHAEADSAHLVFAKANNLHNIT